MHQDDVLAQVREIERVIRGELDDCERALRNNDSSRAKRELDDAITKLQRVVTRMKSLA